MANYPTVTYKLLSALMLCICTCLFSTAYAQGLKTIPGPFQHELNDIDKRYITVSSDGSAVAFYQPDEHITFWIDKSAFTITDKFLQNPRSADLRWEFFNGTGVSSEKIKKLPWPQNTSLGEYEHGAGIVKLGDVKPQKLLRNGTYVLSIDAQGRLLTSRYYHPSNPVNGSVISLTGLWLTDLATGENLEQLRSDPIMRMYYNSHNLDEKVFVNDALTGLVRVFPNKTMQFLPFNTDSVILLAGAQFRYRDDPEYADAHYLYIPDDRNSDINIWSLHTGKLLLKKEYKTSVTNPAWNYRRCLYYLGNGNGIYRLDREQGKLYHELPDGNDMRILNEWQLDTASFPLAAEQAYVFGIAKGPSLLIAPRFRKEAPGPDNIGYVIDLNTGKTKVRIAPFYTPPEELLAQEKANNKRVQQLNAESEAKRLAKEKEAAAKILQGKPRCDSVLATITLRGLSMGRGASYKGETGLWVGFDCATDMVIFRVPGNNNSWGVKLHKIKAYDFAANASLKMIYEQKICPRCEGAGCQVYGDGKLYAVEMPSYYMPGYKVTKYYSGDTKKAYVCERCKGTGIEK